MLDVRQSEQLVYTAAASIPDLERRIEQQENLISILLGRNPAPVTRGKPLVENVVLPTVPAGLPSSLLARRPDIQSVEQQLVAANAQIGVAKAAYFPQITLTALAGYQSSALTDLFTGPAGLWSFGGQLAQPIFTAGKIRSNVRLTEAQKEEAVLIYQQSNQQAFRETHGLAGATVRIRSFGHGRNCSRSSGPGCHGSQRSLPGWGHELPRVLDSDTRYFDAQLGVAQAQLNERLALVQLYNALGGGWQQ